MNTQILNANKQSGMTKVRVILIGIAVIVVAASLGYFFAWRPSDTDVDQAITSMATVKNSTANTLPAALTTLSTPISITTEVASEFKSNVTTYQKAVTALDTSPAIKRNGNTGSAYEAVKAPLTKYGDALQTLSTSITLYVAIQSACNTLMGNLDSINTHSEFVTASTNCSKAIDGAKSSRDTSFNDQFFTEYREKAGNLLTAVSDYFTASDKGKKSDISTATGRVFGTESAIANMQPTIKYAVTPPSNDALNKLSSALASEKSSFLR